MDRRIAWAVGLTLVGAAVATAQPPAGTGYYPAAPGPVMALPSNQLFPDALAQPAPPAPAGPAPRYPLDENGNRAINWFYGHTELLWGWTRDRGGRPIATTGDALGRGVLGEPGTASLGTANNFDEAFGVRTTAGYWLTPARRVGFEASGFVFERQTTGFATASDAAGNPILARPFFDAGTNQENARNLAIPDAFAGRVGANSSLRVYGADGGWVFNAICRDNWTVDVTAGFKFLALIENLNVSDFSQALPNGLIGFNGGFFAAPSAVGTTDHVSTQNRFYGPTLGLRLNADYERVTFSAGGRLGFGWVRQSQTSAGSTTFYADGVNPTATALGGSLIVASNTGRLTRTECATVSELNVKLGYRVTRRVGVFVGYDFLFLSDAVRPADAVQAGINPNQMPTAPNFGIPFGPVAPAHAITSSDFLLHAFNGGILVTF
jgi:hypothetical protein